METATVPQTFRALLECFRSCFTRPGFGNFVPLIVGWIICQGRHSISRVIQAAQVIGNGDHHSNLYRFLSKGRWSTDDVGRVLLRLLLPFSPAEVTLILDDTLSRKSGPHIFGAAMHYDAHRSTYGRGTAAGRKGFFEYAHNWVVAAIWIRLPWGQGRGLAVPILFRIYRSKKRCPQRKYRKRTEIAAELIDLVSSWLPEGRRLHVVGDAEYACRTIVRKLPDNASFTGPMSMDAALYASPTKHRGRGRPRRKGKRLPSPQKLGNSWRRVTVSIYGKKVIAKVKMMTCLWYTVAGTRLVRVIVTRDPSGRIADRAYFTTAVESSADSIMAQFARRWEIEVAFRNTKQAMGIQDPQNGWWRRPQGTPRPKKRPGPDPREHVGHLAINHTLAMAFVAYALTIVHYLAHGDADRDVERARAAAPWYTHKSNPSFNDMLAAIRREIWAGRLSRHPSVHLGHEEIDDILPHWHFAA